MDPGAIAKLLIRCMRCIVKPVGKTGRRLPIFTSQRVQRLYKIPVSCARQIMLHSTFRAYYYRSDSRASLKAPLSDRRYANAVSRIFIDRAPASREKESRAKKSPRSNIRAFEYTNGEIHGVQKRVHRVCIRACLHQRLPRDGCHKAINFIIPSH